MTEARQRELRCTRAASDVVTPFQHEHRRAGAGERTATAGEPVGTEPDHDRPCVRSPADCHPEESHRAPAEGV